LTIASVSGANEVVAAAGEPADVDGAEGVGAADEHRSVRAEDEPEVRPAVVEAEDIAAARVRTFPSSHTM
jgi:hypothetical protein